tara:strand:- start:78 stop:245 length:168 start_codon:yes stop_codon:yes gene_type:complete
MKSMNNKVILNQVNNIMVDILKVQFPFDEKTMSIEKYNESLQDYLYEEIITKLTK